MIKLLKSMTKARANQIIKQVRDHAEEAGKLLLEYRYEEGWSAMGYESFKEACEEELSEIFGSRSHIYRLITQEEVSALVSPKGDTVPLAQTRILAALPEDKQRAAYKAAGGSKATTETVAAAVSAAAADLPKPKKKSKAADAGKSTAKYQEALDRVGKIAGREVKAGIEKGVLSNLTPKEVIFWAKLKDDQMADIQTLIVEKRWKPTVAWKQVNKMVTGDTRVSELTNLCIANGGEQEWTVDGFTITCAHPKRRK
jgi:hypothetical protein